MERERNDEITAEQFYEQLREEDREFVHETVGRLKDEGFDVYVTGGSLERRNYSDVDIVITPKEGMTYGDALSGLENAVKNVRRVNIIDKTKDPVSYVCLDSFPSEITYSGSEVESRVILHSIDFDQDVVDTTKASIDIVLTNEPFSVIPETKRIKL